MAKPVKTSGKRELIIRAAECLFKKHGFKRITVDEICREAGAAKMTFYKYFNNKTDLVKQIKDVWMEEAFSKFDEIKALSIPFPEKIQKMTQWKTDFSSKIGASFIREAVSLDEDLGELKRRYLANIVEAQQQGEIRPDIDPEFLWMVLDKLHDLAREGRYLEVLKDYSAFQHQTRTLIYYGLLTRPGAEDQQAGKDLGQ